MPVQTFTFNKASDNAGGQLDIEADVHLPEKSEKPLPVIVWFHGGGLLLGSRKGIASHLSKAPEKHQVCIVAADYRLAPQAKLPTILEDVKAVAAWVKNDLDKLLGGGKIQPSNVSLCGSSAGGYLALLGGAFIKDIRSVLAIYPITDPSGTFFATKQKPFDYPPLSKAVQVTHDEMMPVLDPQAPVVSGSPYTPNARSSFYSYMLQQAALATLVFEDAVHDGPKYKVSNLIKPEFPPTFVVTTVRDRFVGPEQSEDVVDALKKQGVKHEFEVLEDPSLDHAFDVIDTSVTMEKMYTFWSSQAK